MLKQRILTALILGVILVGIIFSGSTELFALLLVTVVGFSAWEWAALCGINNGITRKLYGLSMAVFMIILYFVISSSWQEYIPLIGTIWWCIAIFMVINYQQGKKVVPDNSVLKFLIGCLVLIPASLSLIFLYDSENGAYQVLVLFILIWIVDSAAYFIGRQWGKRRLASNVSPGKSWEGFIGSLFFALLPAGIYIYINGITGIEPVWIIMLFIITAGFSAIGDLFESMYKRNVNLKDSSQLLPGHGGLLDRIDSLTAAAPVFISGLWLLGEKT